MKSELKAMFTEHWKYLAVNSACELHLFDKIFYGQNSTEKLIQNNSWDLKNLINLLGIPFQGWLSEFYQEIIHTR